jgi:hypothetical protein
MVLVRVVRNRTKIPIGGVPSLTPEKPAARKGITRPSDQTEIVSPEDLIRVSIPLWRVQIQGKKTIWYAPWRDLAWQEMASRERLGRSAPRSSTLD